MGLKTRSTFFSFFCPELILVSCTTSALPYAGSFHFLKDGHMHKYLRREHFGSYKKQPLPGFNPDE
jgi:hypothetical protein